MRLPIAASVLALAIALALAPAARAEEGPTAPAPQSAPPPAFTQAQIDDARDESIGIWVGGLFLGGLGGIFAAALVYIDERWAPVLAFASAALPAVGPSVGHYRLGAHGRATATMLARLALGGGGTLLFGYGLAYDPAGDGAIGTTVGAAACWATALALGIVDLATFGAYRKPASPRPPPAVEVAPTAWAGPSAGGLGLAGSF